VGLAIYLSRHFTWLWWGTNARGVWLETFPIDKKKQQGWVCAW
jgi:hypothetical protein